MKHKVYIVKSEYMPEGDTWVIPMKPIKEFPKLTSGLSALLEFTESLMLFADENVDEFENEDKLFSVEYQEYSDEQLKEVTVYD